MANNERTDLILSPATWAFFITIAQSIFGVLKGVDPTGTADAIVTALAAIATLYFMFTGKEIGSAFFVLKK